MATIYWLNASNTQVAQVETITITADSTDNDEVWTLTLTLDDGSTKTVSYTEDGSPTVAEIATGLFTNWNASTDPDISKITAANPSDGVVTLTADTAGVPFVVALADTGDGTHTQSTSTANVGNNDWNTARNWSTNTVPTTDDDVIIQGPASGNSVAILYGLNQSGVALDDVYFRKDYNAQVGRFENGKAYYLRLDPNSFDYRASSSLALIDLHTAAIAPYIEANGTAGSNRHALYLKAGANITTLTVKKGNVGLAVLPGETITVATIVCGFLTNQGSDVNLTIGSGVSLTTLTQNGGTCEQRCASTTSTCASGATLTTSGSGAIGTLNAYGNVFPNSTGTVTTLNWRLGNLDFSRDKTARTVTTLNILTPADGTSVLPVITSHDSITYTNKPVPPTPQGSYKWVQVG